MERNRSVLGVRKGAWTKEEDNLLRKCVDKFGEGKWHLVPLRAGLNRCRKSCRLRWLNYLRPNLKRGHFSNDEVDLILRLHKLLGNRWSLIAGRLPGRTANDIKNFWNTHFEKKPAAGERKTTQKMTTMITPSNIIRPRPRTFSKLQVPTNSQSDLTPKIKEPNIDEDPAKNKKPSSPQSSSREFKKKTNLSSSQEKEDDQCIKSWWGNLLEKTEKGEATPISFFHDEDLVTTNPTLLGDHGNNYDIDVWDLLSLHD